MKDLIFKTNNLSSFVLIRVAVGLIFLSEGIQKFLFPDTLGVGRFAKLGIPLPELMGPFVGSVEIIAGTLVLLGLATRLATSLLLCIICVAIGATKWPMLMSQGFWPTAHDGRTDFAILLCLLFLLINGSGGLSLDQRLERSRP